MSLPAQSDLYNNCFALLHFKQSRVFLGTIATLSTIMGVSVRLMNVSVSDGVIQSHDRVLQLLRQICGGTLAASTGLSMVTFCTWRFASW